jgi:hypothetical protein
MPETPPLHATTSRHPNPLKRKSDRFREILSRSLDANNLFDYDVSRPELQGLGGHGLLVVAKAATKRDGGGHYRSNDDNALQTLHGLLSFG